MIRHTPMHRNRRLLSALWAVTALTLFCLTAFADDEDARSEAAAHLLQAELALQGSDYLEAVREYRKAAQISESVDVARQATRVGYGFGFNEEALLAAKRAALCRAAAAAPGRSAQIPAQPEEADRTRRRRCRQPPVVIGSGAVPGRPRGRRQGHAVARQTV
jgi:hypothetical protein